MQGLAHGKRQRRQHQQSGEHAYAVGGNRFNMVLVIVIRQRIAHRRDQSARHGKTQAD